MIRSHEIKLHYVGGSSDKLYNVWLERAGGSYTVKYAYGRRGSTMRIGTKVGPTDSGTAFRAYNKIVAEQLKQGYGLIEGIIPTTEAEFKSLVAAAAAVVAATGPTGSTTVVGPGSPLVSPVAPLTKDPEESGAVCQLLNPIEESELTLFLDDKNWVMQEKFDGHRQMLRKGAKKGIKCFNRNGRSIEPNPIFCSVLQSCFEEFSFLLDGETVGDKFYVFDLIGLEKKDLREKPYKERLTLLGMLIRSADEKQEVIIMAEDARTKEEKKAMLARMREENKEGIVLKKLDAPYVGGRPSKGGPALKFPFWAKATCVVLGINDKRSVQIGVLNDGVRMPTDTLEGYCPIGNVSIPINQEIPKKSDLIDVRYLYCYPGGSLFKPVCLGIRADKTFPDKRSSLKFKAE